MDGPKAVIPLPYYGWFVLAASALSELLAIGATSYAAGLFVLPLQAEFGLSRADASSSLLLVNLGAIAMAPFAGRILDRYPIRLVVAAGAVCFSLGLTIIALTSALWLMVAALVLPLAMGFAILGPMTTATLASRWFFRRRGLALGIAAIATSAGGLVVVPILSRAIQEHGWRNALLGEAAVMLVVIAAISLLVLKDSPYHMGLGGHAENAGRGDGRLLSNSREKDAAAEAAWPWRRILSARGFWAPTLLLSAVSGLCQAIVITAPPYGHQLGFGTGAAAFLISAFSIAAALTKITAGVMADYWDRRVLLFFSALLMPAAMATLCLFVNYWAVMAACCLAGMALGGTIPTCAFLIASRFGAAHFGSVIGWTYFFIFSSTIAAVRFMGTMFDLAGNYHLAFGALLGFSIFAWGLALFIDMPLRTAA